MMSDAESGGPLYDIEVDSAEFSKCSAAELQTFFFDIFNCEQSDYVARNGTAKRAWAAVDLDKYSSIEDFVAQCRKVHKGNAIRDALKSQKLGYYSKFFDYMSYVPDIVSVNLSKPVRGGQPMTASYTRTIEESGGYPKRINPAAIPSQAAAWVRQFGLFRRAEGHRQGDAVSDEQMLAYLSFRRYGNFTFYGAFIGHADHLDEGIMYKMHLDLVELLLKARDTPLGIDPSLDALKGIRFIGYTEYYGIRPGLLTWKKRMLFEPVYLQFDYMAPAWADFLCAAAASSPQNVGWQERCARMLPAAAQRCAEAGLTEATAKVEAELAAVTTRLSSLNNAAA